MPLTGKVIADSDLLWNGGSRSPAPFRGATGGVSAASFGRYSRTISDRGAGAVLFVRASRVPSISPAATPVWRQWSAVGTVHLTGVLMQILMRRGMGCSRSTDSLSGATLYGQSSFGWAIPNFRWSGP